MLPPFQTFGASDDDEVIASFYAIAYVPGTYLPATAAPEAATLGLYVTTSPLFAPFSLTIYGAPDARLLSGMGPNDYSLSLEAKLFEAALKYWTPLHAWLLYPSASIPSIEWPDADREAYEAARNRLSLFLYRHRIGASLQAAFPVRPWFSPTSERTTPPESQIWPDQAEIERGMLAEMNRLEADGPTPD